MIIWSGFGFLVVVSLILGGICGMGLTEVLEKAVGPSAANFDNALIFLFGAVVNFLFGLLLYKNAGKAKTNHRTGEVTVSNPNHSLFFIPFRAFTVIFAVVGVIMIFPGLQADPIPAYSSESEMRFRDITRSHSNGSTNLSGGNTEEAALCARNYQAAVSAVVEESFTGGSIKSRAGTINFATYCVFKDKLAIFIVDVEDFRSYRDTEAKNALLNITWNAASELAREAGVHSEANLIVHLREGSLSRLTQKGPIRGDYTSTSASTIQKRLFHHFDDSTTPWKGRLKAGVPAEETTNPDPEANESQAGDTLNEQGREIPAPSNLEKPPKDLDSTGQKTPEPNKEKAPPVPENSVDLSTERTWKNTEGNEMVAKFVSVDEDGNVSFMKSDGVTYKYALDKLSPEDQSLIREHLRQGQ